MAAMIRCERCKVQIPADKLDLPNRCVDWRCPTSTYEARMENAKRIGKHADLLAAHDAIDVDLRALADLQAAE